MGALQGWLRLLQQDPEKAIAYTNSIKAGGEGSNFSGQALSQLRDTLQRIAFDYVNTGGITDETRRMIGGASQYVGEGGGSDLKFLATKKMLGALKNWTNQLPSWNAAGQNPKSLEDIGIAKIYGKPTGTSQADFMGQYVTNNMLQYLDPETKRETMMYLARANPMLFRRYALAEKVDTGQPQEGFNQDNLRDSLLAAAKSMDFGSLTSNLPQFAKTGMGQSPSSLGWMKDYLNTAAGGMGGTRSQQQQAAARLKTLEAEAAGKPQELGQFLTLAENMTNPIYGGGPPLSGLIGQRRGIHSGEQFMRRGLVRRNVGQL